MVSFQWLKSGQAVLIGAILGAYIGLVRPEYVKVVEPFGSFYIQLLQMCILPILLCAISLSIGKLLKQTEQKGFILRLITIFTLSLLSASLLGTSIGYLVNPGQLDSDALVAVNNIIYDLSAPDLKVNLFATYSAPTDESILKEFFSTLVPSNIFNALSNGYTIKVLFFATLFGCTIGSLNNETADHIFLTLEAIYSSFSKLVTWLMYIFPLGICGLLAATLSKIGFEAVIAMIKFVPLVILTFIVWFFAMSLVMKLRVGSFINPLKALKDPIIISLSSANTMASLPSALEAMNKSLGYNKEKIDFLIPLTFTLCRIGPTLYFSLATIFVIQLYGLEMNLGTFVLVVLGSVLAGMATAGSSGVSLLTMLGIVSSPLGLPLDAVLILFVVIDPIIAPFRVLAIVHSSCALITLVFPKKEQVSIEQEQFSEERS